MSRTYIDRPASLSLSGITASVARAGTGLVRGIIEWQRRQRTYRELKALDDRQLADIGVNRGDIEIAVCTARRSPQD
jgi:uncharacterized protein YjiS (DUF1127 family)